MTIPTRTERQQWRRGAQAVEANPHLYELDSTLTSARRILALLDALTAKDEELARVSNAAKVLVAGADRRVLAATEREPAARVAIATLDSEREMNAKLTEELERAEAASARLTAQLGHEAMRRAEISLTVGNILKGLLPDGATFEDTAREVVRLTAQVEALQREMADDEIEHRSWVETAKAEAGRATDAEYRSEAAEAQVTRLTEALRDPVRSWINSRIEHHKSVMDANYYGTGNDGAHDLAELARDILVDELRALAPATPPEGPTPTGACDGRV